jgi:hypothetical protein
LISQSRYLRGTSLGQDHEEGRAVDRTITLTASLIPEEGGYVARCLELPVTTGGDAVEEAVAMLRVPPRACAGLLRG